MALDEGVLTRVSAIFPQHLLLGHEVKYRVDDAVGVNSHRAQPHVPV